MDWKEIVYYDETSPSRLRWKVDVYRNSTVICSKDSTAGFQGGELYWRVSYKGYREGVHRIVWELHNGKIPEGMFVDHVDRDKKNNIISNLRLCTHHQNNTNKDIHKDNKSGVTGVRERFTKYTHSFIAYWVDGDGVQRCKSFSVKKYGTELAFSLACEARKKAEQLLREQHRLFY